MNAWCYLINFLIQSALLLEKSTLFDLLLQGGDCTSQQRPIRGPMQPKAVLVLSKWCSSLYYVAPSVQRTSKFYNKQFH